MGEKIKKFKIIVILIFGLFIMYNVWKAVISGNQLIEVITSNNNYAGESMNFSINVKDYKTKDFLESNLKIELQDSKKKKIKNIFYEGKTDENGKRNISLDLPLNLQDGKYYLKIKSSSKKGRDVVTKAITILNQNTKNITVALDKGIYKPGDTINYRVLVTSRDDDNPVEKDVVISIYDGNDNRVYIKETKTSEYGITSGSFTLANEVNSGKYTIKVLFGSTEKNKEFTVNPYITPQFDAKIETEKDTFLVNDKIKILVNSKYFFGEPVKNAKVKLKINEQENDGFTNDEGIFEYEYLAEKKETLNIKANIVDESNYLVEEQKTVFVSEDIFEVEVLPEYKNIISGIENNIYFFVKTPNGIGKKAYIYVNFGDNKNRQIITDENGIGVLNIPSSDLNYNGSQKKYNNGYTNTLTFNIQAKDMEGNLIEKKEKINIEDITNSVIKTDKVKYNQEDDIVIKLNKKTEIREETIAICKNNKVLKLITTDTDEVVTNLDDIYGLIDIYVLDNSKTNIENKRTIFIKPNKMLNIEIKTDKAEYKPKENIELNLNIVDENGKNPDTALLISALDEAILKLAENDLSIDNIKISLEDIKLSNELDAATLYANIIDNKSENSIMAILLRQNRIAPNINKSRISNVYKKNNAILRIVYAIIIFIIICNIYFIIKYKKFRNVIKEVLIYVLSIGFSFIFILVTFSLIRDNLFYMQTEHIFIVSAILTLIFYILVLYKFRKIFARMAISYGLVFGGIFYSVEVINEFNLFFKWIIIAVEVLIFPIISIVTYFKTKNVKENTKNKALLKFSIEMIKSLIISIITAFATISEFFAYIVFIILNLIYELKFNKKNELEKTKSETSIIKWIGVGSIGTLCLIVIIFIGYISISNSGIKINKSSMYGDNEYYSRDITDEDRLYTLDSMQEATKNFDSKSNDRNGIPGLLDITQSLSGQSNSIQNSNNEKNEIENNEYSIENESIVQNEKTTQENVRSIFLESLCFIPELIAKEGKINTNIPLSDNITTWKLQIVGNTKEGNIGFNEARITVKKDFFVNFNLPENTIVGDEIKIPVTIFNYTANDLVTFLDVENEEWFEISSFEKNVNITSNSAKMVYIPIKILKNGENKFKVKAQANDIQDIVQKTIAVKNKGVEVSKVLSSGMFENQLEQDIIIDEHAIENTRNLKIKMYPSTITQVVEGLENIFKMPTGCFEQTSSSLYPDVMVLKYMEEKDIINENLRKKAMSYISSGYQRLLTFEVPGEKGGYSLYGESPSNPSLTAYGLMELTDLNSVYEIDSRVLENMKNYLYKRQRTNGSFDLGSTYYSNHVIAKTDDLTLNCYIIWALSEVDTKDTRLNKSIEYVKSKIDKLEDSYTLALVANIFANVNDQKNANILIERLLNKTKNEGNILYLESKTVDPYGSYGNTQNLQTTALTSIVLSKTNISQKMNSELINYIISRKNSYGTWNSTQSTILCLKALVEYKDKYDLSNQKINISLNGETKTIEIEKDALDLYELKFENLSKENHLNIQMEKGKIYYEILEEYSQEANLLKEESKNKININFDIQNECKVNDIVLQEINIKNNSNEFIKNGMVEITIPQGFSVLEESLSKLVARKVIKKYEYNYSKIYLYIENFEINSSLKLEINYRANYPGKITGGAIRVYDYYNPEVEGIEVPIEININE